MIESGSAQFFWWVWCAFLGDKNLLPTCFNKGAPNGPNNCGLFVESHLWGQKQIVHLVWLVAL